MILGMSLPVFTAFHVLVSLAALAAGIPLIAGFLKSRDVKYVTVSFLTLTTATSVTGFLFPATQLLPSHITGIISLAALALAGVALRLFHTRGTWRVVYVVCAVIAFYLNTFVAVVQAFLKVPGLHDLAPTGTEPPFLAVQVALLLTFVAVGFISVKRFHPALPSAV